MKNLHLKIYKIFISAIILCIAISCGDEHQFLTDVEPVQGLHIKVLHAAYDGLEIQTDPPAPGKPVKSIRSVDFYLNGQKLSGSSIGYGGAFPLSEYAVVETANILDSKAPFSQAAPPTPELPEKQLISNVGLNLSGNGHYTVAIFGTDGNRETLIFTDEMEKAPIDGQCYVRFINLMANSDNGVNVFVTPPTSAGGTASAPIMLFENVKYRQVSGDFIALPVTGTYTAVQVRDAVTGTVLATMSSGNSVFTGSKVYTLHVRGQQGLVSTTANPEPKAPIFDRMINR